MYKSSMFNYLSPEGILFNSLSGKIVNLESPALAKKILDNPIKYSRTDLGEKLLTEHFLVPESLDEVQCARSEEFRKIYLSKFSLIIFPTMDCNFRCEYCYQEHKSAVMSREVQNAIIKHLVKNIRNYTSVDIGWFGGEPLLEIETLSYLSEKIIGICRQAKRQYSATISTNGYYLDYKIFKRLLAMKVISYQVTLDGDKEHHDRLRKCADGTSSYDRIMENLKEISRQATSASFSICIRTNVTADMLADLEGHLKILWDNFGSDRRFSFLFRPVGNWGGKSVQKLSDKLLNNMKDIYDILLKSKYRLNYMEYYRLLAEGMCEARRYNSYAVDADGILHKCTLNLNSDINILGKIQENGDFLLDQNKIYEWTLGRADSKKGCRECFYSGACHGSSCPLKNQEGISPTDSMCGYEKENIDSVLQLILSSDKIYGGRIPTL